MKMTAALNKETHRVPVWALGYLVNDEKGDLTEGEIALVDRFEIRNLIMTTGVIGEEYFAHTNDIDTLGGMCVDVECLVLPS